jgi:GTPase SAR1 family protein
MAEEEKTESIEMEKVKEGKYVVKQSAFEGEGIVVKAETMSLDPSTHKWKAFLAGPSGSGKTTAINTLPGKKLLVDFDNRAGTVAGLPDIDVYPIHEADPKSPQAWNKAVRLKDVIISEVRQGIFPYDGVFFDGLTMMGRISLNWALLLDSKRGLGGSPARQHYGPQMDNLAKYVLSTLALPLHIVYSGHIELFQDDATGAQKFYPKITGKLRTEVANWFNETYYCYRANDTEGKLCYYWQTAGSGRQEFDFDSEEAQGFEGLWERRFGGKAAKKGGEDVGKSS